MVYKVATSEVIKDDNTALFFDVIVGVNHTTAPNAFGSVSGYASGGIGSPNFTNVIDKFPFSSDGNATDVGDLTVARRYMPGQQV